MCPQNMHIFKFLIWEWVLKKKKIKYTTTYFKVHSSEMRGLYIMLEEIDQAKFLKVCYLGIQKSKVQKSLLVVFQFMLYIFIAK